MRPLLILPLVLTIFACHPPKRAAVGNPPASAIVPTAPADVRTSVLRINSTQQSWNPWQPWEKNPPRRCRALAAIVAPQQVLTTAELVADASYLELESADGTRFAPATVIAVDYEANLALLGPTAAKDASNVFTGTVPFQLTSPPQIGNTLAILQLEDNGQTLQTQGTLQSVDVSANFLPGHNFLTYMVKASMQSAANSYSLPVLRGGQLAGVLISYNTKDQLCDVAATDIIASFLKAAASGNYAGFPSLGVAIARTEDTSFRQWLQLTDKDGGIYIKSVRHGGAAELAGVKPGDVLLAVDGQAIDRRGYYQHPNYGSLSWGHLIRGGKLPGETAALTILRDGQKLALTATLTREEEHSRLVPNHLFGQAPNYLIKGGLIFQELNRPMLQSFGDDWQNKAPLNLLDAYENPDHYQPAVDHIVFLSGVIPTPATVGYDRLRNLIVNKVNGHHISNMPDLINAFNNNSVQLHAIEFTEDKLTVYLDAKLATSIDQQLIQRGITRLAHAE